MNLDSVSTDTLAKTLLTRPDVLDQNGMLVFPVYQLFCKYGVLPCVDGIAVRSNNKNELEAMAIRRGTGCFKGRLCSIGGRLLHGESYENCLRRQFRSDVGCEIELLRPWDQPVGVGQYAPLKDPLNDPWPKDFGPEDNKHTVSMYEPVRLLGVPQFGTTTHGGQEAAKVEWYTLRTLPGPENFGYDQHPRFVEILQAAESGQFSVP
ncbi:MAG: NUDIX domain-containing protein [Patescibacteria group bacterium]